MDSTIALCGTLAVLGLLGVLGCLADGERPRLPKRFWPTVGRRR